MSSESMARRIEIWPIERLIPYARNPRTHSDQQVMQIAASIAEFGFNNPILADTKAGIIAGHGRLLAARKLQLREVRVIVLDRLSATSDQPLTEDLRDMPVSGWALRAVCAARPKKRDPGGYLKSTAPSRSATVPPPNFHGRKF